MSERKVENQGLTSAANRSTMSTWKRNSIYIFKETTTTLIVKSYIQAKDGKPIGGENIIAMYPGDNHTTKGFLDQFDRCHIVEGKNGLLGLADSYIGLTIKDGKVSGGEIMRNRFEYSYRQGSSEAEPLGDSNAPSDNKKKIRIGLVKLQEMSSLENVEVELENCWKVFGMVGMMPKMPKMNNARQKISNEVDVVVESPAMGNKLDGPKNSETIEGEDELTELPGCSSSQVLKNLVLPLDYTALPKIPRGSIDDLETLGLQEVYVSDEVWNMNRTELLKNVYKIFTQMGWVDWSKLFICDTVYISEGGGEEYWALSVKGALRNITKKGGKYVIMTDTAGQQVLFGLFRPLNLD